MSTERAADSRSSPPVVEEKPPRVGGVAIVCEGGDNPAVQRKGDRFLYARCTAFRRRGSASADRAA